MPLCGHKLNMKGLTPIIRAVFFISAFILSAGFTELFAEHEEFKAIKDLEQMEKKPQEEVILRPEVEYDAEGLKDPFREYVPEKPKVTEKTEEEIEPIAEQPPKLTIQGVIWGGNFSQAIVNNKVVKDGDTVGGAKIISIQKKWITVLFKGKEYDIATSGGTISSNAQP